MKMVKTALLTVLMLTVLSFMASSVFAQTIAEVSSAQAEDKYQAEMAVDGDTFTQWHTAYDPQADPPHYIVVDLGATVPVNGLTYVPRQDGYAGEENGNIGDYTIYVSDDNENFTEVSTGSWDASLSTKQTAEFAETEARYVKLEKATGDYMGIAEIEVLTSEAAAANPQTSDAGVLPYVLLAFVAAGGFVALRKVKAKA